MQLFNGQSADGSSPEFKHFEGSRFLNVWVSVNLGGGTVQVETKTPDGSAFVPLRDGAVTAPGMFTIEAAPFVGQLTLSGSTGASVNAWIEEDSRTWEETVRAS